VRRGRGGVPGLPVRELPDIDPPVVSIGTNYRGASAEVIENRITEVIERQVAGIQGIDRINSTSRDGTSRISIEFRLDRDIDDAANDVRDAVSRTLQALPEQSDAPEVAKADADSQPVMILNMTSTSLTRLEMTDYADRNLVERISTVPGVAQVRIFGAQNYAMRIWLDADALASRGLTVGDVEAALTARTPSSPPASWRVRRRTSRSASPAATAAPLTFVNCPSPARGRARHRQRRPPAASPPDVTPREVTSPGWKKRGRAPPPFPRQRHDQIGLGITPAIPGPKTWRFPRACAPLVEGGQLPNLPPGTELVVAVDNSVFTSEAIHEVYVTIRHLDRARRAGELHLPGQPPRRVHPLDHRPDLSVATFMCWRLLGFSLNLLDPAPRSVLASASWSMTLSWW
jgi:multidrug efflux pump